jgi:ribose transport system substrate-binding protein
MKPICWCVAVPFSLLVVSGCGREAKTGQIEVGLISPAKTSTFHVTLAQGASAEAKAYGWMLDDLAPQRESDFAAQVNIVEDLIQRGVDAISVCSINDKAIAGAIEKANQAGIPVLVHNSLTEIPGVKIATYVGYDQREGGRKCGRKATELLTQRYGSPKGKVVILEGVPGFHTTERKGGFLDAIGEHPEIQVVASQPADWVRTKAADVTENLLQVIPDIDLVFGCSDAMAQGASEIAIQSGKEIFTIGIDGNPDALADVKAGKLTATLFVKPYEMGQQVIRSVKRLLDGQTLPPKVVIETVIVDEYNVDQFL